ncbi:hypothetical protein P43SY_006271 [Pythium insidiosum]|uniref:START domain-containing protein n=1 Tax=Pythium insidiosum TaxID=114742 RepID=A0AAD5Q9H0_PYTIN|nr:hypothetical protein P43SY_006271 [Pythium insidiosum]
MSRCTSSPFAPLQLSSDDSDRLHDVAQLFVDNAVAEYEAFLAQDRYVEAWRWKLVRRKDSVRVYRERAMASAPSAHGRTRVSARRFEASSAPPISVVESGKLPRFQTVGTLAGTLHDCMYGAMNPTVDATGSLNPNDRVTTGAVLATVIEPSLADPFHSLVVKWVVHRRALPVRVIAKNQDLVYVEYTGLTHLPTTGDVVGFHLVHSVSFPQTHQLDALQRGTLSMCTLFRQHTDDTVELFAQGFTDPVGSLFKAVALRSAANIMTQPSYVTSCAQRKKLDFAWRHRREKVSVLHELNDRRRQHELLEAASSPGYLASRTCAVCDAVLMRGAGSLLPFHRKHSAVQCYLCLHETCASCQITHATRGVTCCVLCVSVVSKLDAAEVAAAELVGACAGSAYSVSSDSSDCRTNVSSYRSNLVVV